MTGLARLGSLAAHHTIAERPRQHSCGKLSRRRSRAKLSKPVQGGKKHIDVSVDPRLSILARKLKLPNSVNHLATT